MDGAGQIGPLASRAHYEKVTSDLTIAAQERATTLLYGERSGADLGGGKTGLFVEPIVYATPERTSRVRCKEIFGPIGALISFSREQEAIAISNESEFGLVSGFWSQDVDLIARVSKALRTGVVWIDTWWTFGLNVSFGGYKLSSIDREFGSDWSTSTRKRRRSGSGTRHTLAVFATLDRAASRHDHIPECVDRFSAGNSFPFKCSRRPRCTEYTSTSSPMRQNPAVSPGGAGRRDSCGAVRRSAYTGARIT
ncbi:aldehyde dehydrogenase family protein [Burkholderia stagnalis]